MHPRVRRADRGVLRVKGAQERGDQRVSRRLREPEGEPRGEEGAGGRDRGHRRGGDAPQDTRRAEHPGHAEPRPEQRDEELRAAVGGEEERGAQAVLRDGDPDVALEPRRGEGEVRPVCFCKA